MVRRPKSITWGFPGIGLRRLWLVVGGAHREIVLGSGDIKKGPQSGSMQKCECVRLVQGQIF